jgi:hypothetical protein
LFFFFFCFFFFVGSVASSFYLGEKTVEAKFLFPFVSFSWMSSGDDSSSRSGGEKYRGEKNTAL